MNILNYIGVIGRMIGLVLMLLVGLLALERAAINTFADASAEIKEVELLHLTDVAMSIVQSYYDMSERGEMSVEEAQARALEVLAGLRYEGDNYYWVTDRGPTMLMHGIRADLTGQDFSTFEDPNGVRLFAEMVDVTADGTAGVVDYQWQLPGAAASDAPVDKTSVVQPFAPWGWIIGTGAYLTNIEAAQAQVTAELNRLMILIAAVMMAIAALLAYSMTRPLGKLTRRMVTLAEGDLESPVPCAKDRAAFGKISRAVEGFRIGLIERAEIRERQKAEEAAREQRSIEQNQVVEELAKGLQRLSKGKLTHTITAPFPPDYEKLRQDFNSATEALRSAISVVMRNSVTIKTDAQDISQAADNLSRRTESQAATLEQTSAALDQLTKSVRSAAESTEEATKMARGARKHAENGRAVAGDATNAMESIKESSVEIAKITQVIDDIAFQTNLLALNAGVEAARAGEAGRGFAVVATEVRALSQRTSEAAKEIRTLIDTSGDQVRDGVTLVTQTGGALEEILNSVRSITDWIETISESSQSQSLSINEINTAVSDLDNVTQKNAAMFEETTAASHSLTQEANALVSAVAQFDIGGQAAAGTGQRDRAA